MHTSCRIFCWMWYSFLKKESVVCELAATRRNPPLPTLTFMTQYSISFIFDFKEHHSQNAHSGKKPTVMSTYSFTAEKKFALIFRKLPCPQKFLTTRLQENRNSSEIFLRLFLWFKFISQMFKARTKNNSLKEMLRQNFFSYFFFVLFLFKHIASLNYRKILKRYFRRNFFY